MADSDTPERPSEFDWEAVRARLDRLGQSGERDDGEILRQRAKRLAAPRVRQEAKGPLLEVLSFERSGVRYAVPADQCQEAVRTDGLQELPSVPPFVRAVMLNRGAVTPILEVRWFLDGEVDETTPDFAIIATVPGTVFALAADAVAGIAMVSPSAETTALSGLGAHFITGTTEDLATILDLVGLTGDARFTIDQQPDVRQIRPSEASS